MRMPFGKYTGHPLEHMPTDYLRWLRGLKLREPLRSAVEAEWARRIGALALMPLSSELRPVAEHVIAAGLRVLAQRHHPDRGGDTQAMQQVNAAVTWLRDAVRVAA